MQNDLLKAAIWYCRNGYSVIPVKRNKRPHIKWEEWQTKRADEDQVISWWNKWPDAQVALVCGEISDITVIDADSEDSYRNLNENFIPDSLSVPTSKTSKGYHFYFRYLPGISNSVRFMDECDLRNDGGYILAPPSLNENGSYAWLKGLKINEVPPPEMPSFLVDVIKQSVGTLNANRIGSNHYTSTDTRGYVGSTETPTVTNSQYRNNRNILFEEGGRDETLFHLANHLVKSGMPREEIRKYMIFVGNNCDPPFPENEIDIKISSAFSRNENRTENLTSQLRDFISVTNGNFSVTDALRAVTSVTSPEMRNKVRATLYRMWKNDEIAKVSSNDGVYRKIDSGCEFSNWMDASCEPVHLYLPLELTDKVKLSHGEIILISGAPNSGKSAFLLNVATENMKIFETYYFSSEMRAAKFKERILKMPIDHSEVAKNLKFSDDWSYAPDIIQTGKGKLNIIDYLEMHDQFWLVSKMLYEIYEKLDGAMAVIAVQKEPGREYGRGGSFTQEKPVLSISLDRGKAKITKCKDFPDGIENPEGKTFNFKLVQGHRFMRKHLEVGWGRE